MRPQGLALGATVLAAVGAIMLTGCRPHEQLNPVLRPRAAEPHFSDLADDPDGELIEGLAKLGVMEQAEGAFVPDNPLDRGEYVVWLVRAWNIYYRDDPRVWIRLATVGQGSSWTYLDAMPHTPLYPYLQGMIDAGCLVGFEKGEWHYARSLTREQLILLRNSVVYGRSTVWAPEEERDDYRVQLRAFLKDADAVSEEYLYAVAQDLVKGKQKGNEGAMALAFTDLKFGGDEPPTLDPVRAVRRREAARSLSVLAGRNHEHALLPALGEWKPLPEDEQKALDDQLEKARKDASGSHPEH